jgi:multimeric flavodoxin WrbA
MGNCELVVKAIASNVPGTDASLSMVRLAEKNIQSCDACYKCLSGNCPHKDDFGAVLSAILDADAVIVAAPTYVRGPHSSLQRLLDRGLQFWRHVKDLRDKPAVGVAVAGGVDGEGHALLGVENFLRGVGLVVKGRAVIHAALPGEVLLSESAERTIQALAADLLSPERRPPNDSTCTVCGGSYFDFRGGNRVYCLLCGARGEVIAGDGVASFRTVPRPRGWQAGEESMNAHVKWLREMREKFLRERDRLKEAARRYEGGDFI